MPVICQSKMLQCVLVELKLLLLRSVAYCSRRGTSHDRSHRHPSPAPRAQRRARDRGRRTRGLDRLRRYRPWNPWPGAAADAHPELKSSGISWVNLGPRGLLDFGLPPGCTGRPTTRTIGTHLTLRLPDRRDLIAFKLFAAADAAHGRQSVHKSDLRELAPNEEELRFAIDWVITIPDRNHQLSAELREFLQELGHEDLAYYIA